MNITRISLEKLKSEPHVQFNENISALIEQFTADKLNLGGVYPLYKTAFANELEALDIIRKSEVTPQILEQDSVRDGVFRGFSDAVKSSRNHFDAEYRAAANLLWNILLHYGNVARKPLDAETAAINDMLREFQQLAREEAIDMLGLGLWIAKLDEENKKFNQLTMNRFDESFTKTTHRMKTTRIETDKYYRAMVSHLEYQMMSGGGDPVFNECITKWEAVVKHYKDILAAEFGRKNAAPPKSKIIEVEKLEENKFKITKN